MKRCIISGVIGALIMFCGLLVVSNIIAAAKNEKPAQAQGVSYLHEAIAMMFYKNNFNQEYNKIILEQ